MAENEGQHEPRFYFMKLFSDRITRYWLNPVGEASEGYFSKDHHVAVYFGTTEAGEIRKRIDGETTGDADYSARKNKEWLKENQGGGNWEDLQRFFSACDADKRDNEVIVLFTSQQIYFLKLLSEPTDIGGEELKRYHIFEKGLSKKEKGALAEEEKNDKTVPKILQNPKVCKVDIIERRDKWEVPFILATANADQSLNRGTFKELKSPGHENAIKYCLNNYTNKIDKPENAACLLQHLGPVELETLVFLNFHERGFHVPANRGSTIKDIDIVIESPDTESWNSVFKEIPLSGGGYALIQVKAKVELPALKELEEKLPDARVIALEGPHDNRWLGPDWLLKKTYENRKSWEWLKKELEWLGLSEKELEILVNEDKKY